MKWKGKKILVTGGNGFIGSHLVDDLIEKEADVTLLIRPTSTTSIETARGLENISHLLTKTKIIWGDITDFSVVINACTGKEIIFHMAGQTSVERSRTLPLETFTTNSFGTLNILESAKICGVNLVLYPSSDKAYGDPYSLPVKETSPFQANSPYDVSKMAAEQMSIAYFKSYNLSVIILRLTNVYGARQTANKIIPKLIQRCLRGEPLEIYVDKNGQVHRRDFIHVKDVVHAMQEAVVHADQCAGLPINIGSGVSTGVDKLAQMIRDYIADVPIRFVTPLEAEKEIKEQYVSIELARSLIGWSPKTRLENGLVETINWYTTHPR